MDAKMQEEFEAWWASTPILSENKRTIAEKAWQASRAAPTPKVCECGPLRNITDGGHFPACTRCKRRLRA